MKQSIVYKLLLLCVLLLIIILGIGCAGQKPQIKDKGVKIEKRDATEAAKTVKKPEEEVLVDDKGEFEIISTPFGYVKRRIGQHGKKFKMPGAAQKPSISFPPKVKVPTAPTVSKAESVRPAPLPVAKPTKKAPREKEEQIVFNFDDADLYEVIRTIAELLNINYIVDPKVKGRVTIHTASGLSKKNLFPVFFQILEINGLTAIKEGSLYKIVRLKDAPRMPITSRLGREGEDVPPGERIIIQIIPLNFISAQEMAKLLTPFISADGTIIAHGDSNTLLVVDKGINVLKSLRLVDVFDVSLFEKANHLFYPLENVDAGEAVKILKEAFSPYTTGRKDDVKFIAVTRLNTLLAISSDPRVFRKVREFIIQIDVASEDIEPRIYVYSVKNGESDQLSELLNEVFTQTSSAKKKTTKDGIKKKAGTAKAQRNPFSRKPEVSKKPEVAVIIGKTATTGSGTLRGEIKITSDEIRNSLIIEAIPSDYQIIENILKRLDVLPRQVLIEATVAEITLDDKTTLGVEWTFKDQEWTDTGSLAASIGAAGLQYSIGLTKKWKAALSALAEDKKVDILSSPHVLASDNKEARIDISTEIPVASTTYTSSTDTDVLETNIQYRDTGVILTVTPHINESGLVTMDISQEVSEQSLNVAVAGKDYPSFYKRSVKTTLTVKHGQTLVIGGLIKETKSDSAAGVPCLINIPVIRYLFGKETKNITKTELIVMITPRVIANLEDVDAVTEEFKRKVDSVTKKFRKKSIL